MKIFLTQIYCLLLFDYYSKRWEKIFNVVYKYFDVVYKYFDVMHKFKIS